MLRLVDRLKAVAEPTRLRIVALCAEGELAVSELTHILGQSQPRVSRHLKILTDAGLIAPMREGNWTFYRLERGEDRTSDTILTLLNPDDPVIAADLQRLASVRERREVAAEAYFERHARQWDAIRALYVEEELVEKQLLSHVPPHDFRSHLDIG
ncbi:MAG TPA: metalloregulator ArsR/SmtB family transcription factor, partial [Alphaproteobacteria bacterium]|nr:metalloregulator ArsR/SmtB family transcription factor [Alphaproteobacteria bacterium]